MFAGKTASDQLGEMRRSTAHYWASSIFVFLVCLVGLLLLFAETAATLVEIWSGNSTYSHGFLILPISALLLWNKRDVLTTVKPSAIFSPLFAFTGLVLAWLVGNAASVQLVQQASLIGMIQALFWAVFGTRVVALGWVSLAFLLFAIPFGDFLIAPLQHLTAMLSGTLLNATGIPVYQDSLYIYLPSASFFVAEACSGLRFSISTLVLGILFAYHFTQGWWRPVAVIGLSVILPVVANAARVYAIILGAYYMEGSVDSHIATGWGFFAFVTVIFLSICLLFRSSATEKDHVGLRRCAERSEADGKNGKRAMLVGVLFLLIGAVGSGYSVNALIPSSVQAVHEILDELRVSGDWKSGVTGESAWNPSFPNADFTQLRTYGNGSRNVDAFIGYISAQKPGSEIIHYSNRFDTGEWRRLGSGKTIATVDGKQLTLQADFLASSDKRRLVWYWYWIDGRFTGDPYIAKFLQVRANLFGGLHAAAVIAVATTDNGERTEAEATLREFLQRVESFADPLHSATRPNSELGGES